MLRKSDRLFSWKEVKAQKRGVKFRASSFKRDDVISLRWKPPWYGFYGGYQSNLPERASFHLVVCTP